MFFILVWVAVDLAGHQVTGWELVVLTGQLVDESVLKLFSRWHLNAGRYG